MGPVSVSETAARPGAGPAADGLPQSLPERLPDGPLDEARARRAAERWLREVYRGRVELALPYSVAASERAFVFCCRIAAQRGAPPAPPMLNISLAVPVDGAPPFHLANDDPWGDLASLDRDPSPRTGRRATARINARGGVLAADALVNGARVAVPAWRPQDEERDWWTRFTARSFPGSELIDCHGWDQVDALVAEGGPGTRGVVWIRREANGHEATGHLVYALFDRGRVVHLDGLAGGRARIERESAPRALHLARFHRAPPSSAVLPWRQPAPDLGAAVRKARAWLDDAFAVPGGVVPVDPAAEDDVGRGWLFACNTRRFLEDGDWHAAMADAALVVPKDSAPPFCLPREDPWGWLARWCAGEVPGTDGLAPVAAPAREAAWFPAALAAVGAPGAVEHAVYRDWPEARADVARHPYGARSLVWVRRADGRGRETVGRVLLAVRTPAGVVLTDPHREEPPKLDAAGVTAVHVLRLAEPRDEDG